MTIVSKLKAHAKRALLNVLALARCCTAVLESEGKHGAEDEVALLREELDLVHARLRRVHPRRRPYYSPTERMRLLELMSVRGWSHEQAADHYLVTPLTIATWLKRVDDGDFVKTRSPVNRIPDMVRYATQRLKLFCPRLGKAKIAQILCRAGIEISATTVGRVLRERPAPEPEEPQASPRSLQTRKRRPDDVWHVDLTAVPTRGSGFWLPWLPHSVKQSWPFCWWVAAIVDSGSRRCHGIEAFKGRPTSLQVQSLLDRAIQELGSKPKSLITDREKQFDCASFRAWKRARGIRQRFGKVGKKGSVAIIERFFLSLKNECTRRVWVPIVGDGLRRELNFYLAWYNAHRPHTGLNDRVPDDVYFDRLTEVPINPDDKVIQVTAFAGRANLPVVRLVDAA